MFIRKITAKDSRGAGNKARSKQENQKSIFIHNYHPGIIIPQKNNIARKIKKTAPRSG